MLTPHDVPDSDLNISKGRKGKQPEVGARPNSAQSEATMGPDMHFRLGRERRNTPGSEADDKNEKEKERVAKKRVENARKHGSLSKTQGGGGSAKSTGSSS